MTGHRTRLVLALFAGRGAFRAVAQLAPLALAATWGRGGLDAYAGAVGLATPGDINYFGPEDLAAFEADMTGRLVR